MAVSTPAKRATITSIARELGFGTSTVSFCLSGKAAQFRFVVFKGFTG